MRIDTTVHSSVVFSSREDGGTEGYYSIFMAHELVAIKKHGSRNLLRFLQTQNLALSDKNIENWCQSSEPIFDFIFFRVGEKIIKYQNLVLVGVKTDKFCFVLVLLQSSEIIYHIMNKQYIVTAFFFFFFPLVFLRTKKNKNVRH